MKQSDPIYTGRDLITIVPSASQMPRFVRAAATVNVTASTARCARSFVQMGQDKVTHLIEHIISSEPFAALDHTNCSYTFGLCCRRDLSQMKIPDFLDSLYRIHSSFV